MTRADLQVLLDVWWLIPILIIIIVISVIIAVYITSIIDENIETERNYRRKVDRIIKSLDEKEKENE